jgi:uncharacterized membrane protein YccF (DUF307 family)
MTSNLRPPPFNPAYVPPVTTPSAVRSQREVHVISLEDRRGCSSWTCNLIWALLFGWECFLSWMFVGLILCLSIVGIPFGLQCFKLARVVLFPFGRKLVRRGVSFECPALLGNLLWLPFGISIAMVHFVFGILCYISIIGIPFGAQHCKFAEMALCPFGVDTTVMALHHQVYLEDSNRLLV